jgi:hypothetical protein
MLGTWNLVVPILGADFISDLLGQDFVIPSPTMAATERILIFKPKPESQKGPVPQREPLPAAIGLRVSVRTTTSSLPDYPEWNLDELRSPDRLITDGACS